MKEIDSGPVYWHFLKFRIIYFLGDHVTGAFFQWPWKLFWSASSENLTFEKTEEQDAKLVLTYYTPGLTSLLGIREKGEFFPLGIIFLWPKKVPDENVNKIGKFVNKMILYIKLHEGRLELQYILFIQFKKFIATSICNEQRLKHLLSYRWNFTRKLLIATSALFSNKLSSTFFLCRWLFSK